MYLSSLCRRAATCLVQTRAVASRGFAGLASRQSRSAVADVQSVMFRSQLLSGSGGAPRSTVLRAFHSSPRLLSEVATPKIPELVNQGKEGVVGLWLAGCSGMVFSMVVVGGITRLTRSGLSMTDWKLQGSLPPSTPEEWEAEFTKYKRSPEYKIMNAGMTVEEFKSIFWWEYIHRMWGRTLGVVFAVPAAYFWARGYLKPALMKRLGVFFGMGGLQGLVGWWMVKSGLEEPASNTERVSVSPYRLAAHLASAFVIYSGLAYTTFSLLRKTEVNVSALAAQSLRKLRGMAHPISMLVGITAISGAFVAGLDAGRIYNEFPFMGKGLVPPEIFEMEPTWKNFFENLSTVQFQHRWLAIATLTGITGLYAALRKAPLPAPARLAVNLTMAVASLQVALGITTLLTEVPVSLGAAHQAGALTLFTCVLYLMHAAKYPSARGQVAKVVASAAKGLPKA